jgi:DNA-binding SARP family transcriptional activator
VAFEAQLGPSADQQALAAGLALYRDDFLAGFTLRDSPAFDEWQFFEAERLRQLCLSTLERLVELYSRTGDHDGAIAAARRRLALDPLHEPAYRALMRAYAAAGQRAAALRQYRLCAQLRVRAGETVAHGFAIDELGVNAVMPAGAESLALFRPTTPGTYTVYCPPHYDKASGQGMHGTLIVEP